jgi:hypothetical protein
MARFVIAGRSTVAGATALRPLVTLYATTGVRPRVREVGITNTTANAVCVAVSRITGAGTPGAALAEITLADTTQAAIATGVAGHTADVTTAVPVRQTTLGAAAGSGVIFTFGGEVGLVIPNTTTDGVSITVPTGTGQIVDYWIEWEE